MSTLLASTLLRHSRFVVVHREERCHRFCLFLVGLVGCQRNTHRYSHAHTHNAHKHTHARAHTHTHTRTRTRKPNTHQRTEAYTPCSLSFSVHARTHAHAHIHTHTHTERERERQSQQNTHFGICTYTIGRGNGLRRHGQPKNKQTKAGVRITTHAGSTHYPYTLIKHTHTRPHAQAHCTHRAHTRTHAHQYTHTHTHSGTRTHAHARTHGVASFLLIAICSRERCLCGGKSRYRSMKLKWLCVCVSLCVRVYVRV